MDIEPRVINFFHALADETRLKILISISHGPITVSDIHEQVRGLTMSAISHQLRLMTDLGMITFKKKGRKKFYALSDQYCWCILRDALKQIPERKKCPHCLNIVAQGGLE